VRFSKSQTKLIKVGFVERGISFEVSQGVPKELDKQSMSDIP